ncbi:VanZ family protein [Tundrisphaera sp. TA3]|uniref:VanZ family protein n=1 Tax=Tundrisphaera sp. TA3 TaxID=3435775 RepID=UPI003EB92A7E
MFKRFAAVVLVVYLAVLCRLTLFMFLQPVARPNFIPLRTIRFDLARGGEPFVVNILGNLGVFLPMGFLVPILWPRRSGSMLTRVAAASFGLSLLIEVLQYLSGRRIADVDDLLLNTLGGMLGYGLWLSCLGVARIMGLRMPSREDWS